MDSATRIGSMKAREAVRFMRRQGAVLVRKRGDHHLYVLNGAYITLPCGGAQTEVSPGILSKIRRAVRGQDRQDRMVRVLRRL
jgi:predicted RNA binding protein YcfA (HicA-like mRNA interferase family)